MSTHVTLVSGTNRLTTDVDSDAPTVGTLRSDFAEALNIPSDAVATVNGSRASDSQRVRNSDEVAFTKPTGSKG